MRRGEKRQLGGTEVLEVERHLLLLPPAAQAAIDGGAVDAQQLRSLADIAAGEAQCGFDVGALPRLQRFVEIEGVAALEKARRLLENRAGGGAAACSGRIGVELQIELRLQIGRRN